MQQGRVVLLAGPGESTAIVYNALRREFPVTVILEQRVPRTSFVTKRVKRLGFWTTAGQVLFRALVVPLLHITSRARLREIRRQFALDATAIPPEVIIRVDSVNSEQAISTVRRLEPSLVVVNGTRILSAAVLNAVPCKFINIHAGITPLYRGVHGAYWALVQRRPAECGVTVHVVDTGIDTGDVIAQSQIACGPRDNFVTYPYLQIGTAIPLLMEAVHAAQHGELRAQRATAGASRLWSHPTMAEYIRNRVQLGVR